MTKGKYEPLSARLYANGVRTETGCLEWAGSRIAYNQYGRIGNERGARPAIVYTHRAAWMLENGPIPEGMVVRHKCDNPPCFELSHLELGTHFDNMRDMVRRGRHRGPRRALSDQQVLAIQEAYASGVTYVELADDYGVSGDTIYRAIHDRRPACARDSARLPRGVDVI